MLNFIKSVYRVLVEIVLWIIPFACAYAGGDLGAAVKESGGGDHRFLGVFIGLVVGILIDVLVGGLIATFLSMDEKLQNMDKSLQRLTASTNNNPANSNSSAKAVTTKVQKKAEDKHCREEEQRIEKLFDYFTDPRDGQKYRTVKIGGKTWMAQNLNYQPQTGNSWCYDDNNSNSDTYGRLYDWNTAKSISPAGWHLPTRQEWNDLAKAAGGDVAGATLKSGIYWNGTNDYGFSALPGGYLCTDGCFKSIGIIGSWWTATEHGDNAYYRDMGNNDKVNELDDSKELGLSVRCVKND